MESKFEQNKKWLVLEGFEKIIQKAPLTKEFDWEKTDVICSLDYNCKTKDEILANAHLIAAAPEMLEALQLVRRLLDKDDQSVYEDDLDAVNDTVLSAINKALGKA